MAQRRRKQCVICKKAIPSERSKKNTCSVECGIEKSCRIAEQMKNKKGKYWRKATENLNVYWSNYKAKQKRKDKTK